MSLFWDGGLIIYVLNREVELMSRLSTVLNFRLTLAFLILLIFLIIYLIFNIDIRLFLILVFLNISNTDIVYKSLREYHSYLVVNIVIYSLGAFIIVLLSGSILFIGFEYYIIAALSIIALIPQYYYFRYKNFFYELKFLSLIKLFNFYKERINYFVVSALSIIQVAAPIFLFGLFGGSVKTLGEYRESLLLVAPFELLNVTFLIFLQQQIGSKKFVEIYNKLRILFLLSSFSLIAIYWSFSIENIFKFLNIDKNVNTYLVNALIGIRFLNTISVFSQLSLFHQRKEKTVTKYTLISILISCIALSALLLLKSKVELIYLFLLFEIPYFVLIGSSNLWRGKSVY